MDYIKQQYKKSFLFFKVKLKKLTIIVGVVFLAVIAVSAIYLKQHPDVIQSLLTEFMDMVNASGIVSESGGISSIGLMINNLKACLMSVIIGLIPFLFLPLITLLVNASLIGAMFGFFMLMNISFASLFAGLIPHGIFEIPALLISMAMGIYLCKELTMKMIGKRKNTVFMNEISEILNFYVCMIVPLLIIAGIIEAYVTPLVMNMFM